MYRSLTPFCSSARRLLLLCGLIALTLPFAPAAMASDQAPSEPISIATSTSHPADVKVLLVTTLMLAGVMIGMERFCSARLVANQRRAAADRQTLAAALPPLPATTPGAQPLLRGAASSRSRHGVRARSVGVASR